MQSKLYIIAPAAGTVMIIQITPVISILSGPEVACSWLVYAYIERNIFLNLAESAQNPVHPTNSGAETYTDI